MDNNGPIQIDLSGIIRSRVGKRGRFIPSFILKMLERLICQKRLNELLRECYPARGHEFAHRLLKTLNISIDVEGLDDLPEDETFEFVSNHPLGGLDGIALVGVLGGKYGDDNIRVVVNDLLLHVEPLKDVFVPVNKFGGQGRSGARAINEAFASRKHVLMFPAGLVSRLQPDGHIEDLEWQKMFVAKALESGRRVVPIRFDGLNTMRFYRTAYWRKRLGIKVNVEQAILPSELCRAEGNRYAVRFGKPIDVAKMHKEGMKPKEIAQRVKSLNLSLACET